MSGFVITVNEEFTHVSKYHVEADTEEEAREILRGYRASEDVADLVTVIREHEWEDHGDERILVEADDKTKRFRVPVWVVVELPVANDAPDSAMVAEHVDGYCRPAIESDGLLSVDGYLVNGVEYVSADPDDPNSPPQPAEPVR